MIREETRNKSQPSFQKSLIFSASCLPKLSSLQNLILCAMAVSKSVENDLLDLSRKAGVPINKKIFS